MGSVDVTRSYPSQGDEEKRAPITTTVLIIGGGATGLLSSILLARNGIDSIVVERYEQRLGQPKAHALNPRSLEILKQAGIDTIALRRMGMSPTDGDMVRFAASLSGLEFGSLPYERQENDTKGITPEPLFNISQPAFEQVLIEAVENYKIVSLKKLAQFNATYPCHKEDGTQKQWASSILDKKLNEDFIIKSKYILICDGASSASRAKFGIPFSIMPGHSAEVFHNVSIHFDADLRQFKSGTLWFFMRESQRGTMICYNRQNSWVYVVRRRPDDEPTSMFSEEYCRSMIDDVSYPYGCTVAQTTQATGYRG
jgi:2,4-dichlorophenol 6-monooxygenase